MKLNAELKNISIRYNASPEIQVFADINLLSTVLRNLISNAIKFTNKGGTVEITATKDSDALTISVIDNGIGINSEKISRLFEATHLKSTKGTENESGTGLGLMICKDFIEKHNGKIWVKSEVGKGSEFCFTLPDDTNYSLDELNFEKQ
jgi:signal transduction histidine kinase